MLQAIWHILQELAPWLLLGAAAAGALHVLVPRDVVQRAFSGYAGVLRAVVWGVPMPLCSCAVIPAGIGLKKNGASDGSAIGFLISTPQTGVDSILVSASFLGWPFAIFKLAAAAITGITGGWLTERWGGPAVSLDSDARANAPHGTHRIREGIDHAIEVLRTIWGWLVAGIVLSAAITTFLPPDLLTTHTAAGGLIAALLALGISLPLYVCATASVPIAAALVTAGMPTGAALVFLMAGPATNLATLGAVHRAFGSRIVAIYLATVAVGSIGLGLLFDAVWTTTVLGTADHAMGSPIAVASSVVLLGLLASFAVDDARRWITQRSARTADSVSLHVDGMTCGGCARRVETALRAVDGVDKVVVTLDEKLVSITGTADPAAIRDSLTAAGYAPRAAANE